MSNNKDFNPIESTLYIRQRKTLLTVAVLITAVNLIGGQLITEDNGASNFVLPFGVTFEVARPWLIDWLLLVALIYLLVRYVIFSRYVREILGKFRKAEYTRFIRILDPSLFEFNVTDKEVFVTNFFWFWKYSSGEHGKFGDFRLVKHDVPLSGRVTFLPTLKVELILLRTKNAYSDYYSPYLMVIIAVLSYYFKV